MKKLCMIFTAVLLATQAYSQNFEGKITYTCTYKSKSAGVTDEQLTTFIGSTQEYYISGCRYKSVMNGKMMAYQLYDCAANRLYTKVLAKDTLFWIDASTNDDALNKYEIKKNAATISGYDCDEIIINSKNSIVAYYYSNKLKLDASLFKKHKYENWNVYCEKAGAVPLRMVVETPTFTVDMTATGIKPMTLSDADFAIPANTPQKNGQPW